MKHPPERDWMIVAPWWQWTDPASVPPGQPVTPKPLDGRLSRPIFQKYDSPNLVNEFIKDPQRSLKFVDDDLVHSLQAVSGPSLSKVGKLFRIGASKDPNDPNKAIDRQYLPDGTNTRKIFLDTHKRFYLVVCQIHCDGPGFPKVAKEKVCKAGFVIRRRTITPPSSGVEEVKPILANLAAGRAKLARVNQLTTSETASLSESLIVKDGVSRGGAFQNTKLESLIKTRASLQALLALEKSRFNDWVTRLGVKQHLQGWLVSPQGFDKVGSWEPVDETPAGLGLESSFTLYPLRPDKNALTHAGQYGMIYFGVLPTSSHDHDRTGRARFDDQEFYEVRCWALRHLKPHDPDQPCPCPDGIFWSVPTRPYKLAAHYDLTGTSNQPVTIQLPDLNDLAAQAKPGLGVGFAKPPGSLMISGNKDGRPLPQSARRSSKFEICFIPIPLITIVATFVFELFLPVVMIIFQLWWMLALKFCIPPEIDVAAGISGEIGLDGKIGINPDVNVDASIEAKIQGSVDLSITGPHMVGGADVSVQGRYGADVSKGFTDTYSPIALANMELAVSDASKPASSLSVTANLDFESEVTHA
jgi:hypothetical protein